MSLFGKSNRSKLCSYLRRNGFKNTVYAALERLKENKEALPSYIPPSEDDLKMQERAAEGLFEDTHGLAAFSILVPAYETKPVFLREMLDSVCNQSYPYWELILADASEDDVVEREMQEYQKDSRIRYVKLKSNAGISNNTNEALAHATLPYVGLLDHDDVLTPDCLYHIAREIRSCIPEDFLEKEMLYKQVGANPNERLPQFLYSDEDKWSGAPGEYYEPNQKEDFNLDYLLSNNYICHFAVLKRELIQSLGFRSAYDGAQDYDLFLRAVAVLLGGNEKGAERQIRHIPKILYHWRCHSGSTAENPESKLYAYEAGRLALQSYADAAKLSATAIHLRHLGFYRLDIKTSYFEARPDLGLVGGPVYTEKRKKKYICGGRMNPDGTVLYEGLFWGFSGRLHKAVLTQDAQAVDLRNLTVNPACYEIFKAVTGVEYREKNGRFDIEALWNSPAIKGAAENNDFAVGEEKKAELRQEYSLRLSRAISEAGYRILYDPQFHDFRGKN